MSKRGGARSGTANISPRDRAEYGSRRETVAIFRDMLKDGRERPSTFLLRVMRGDEIEQRKGGEVEKIRASFPERVDIAKHLVQYELPRLASIEADIQTIEKTHEEWVRELAGEATEKETLQ